MAIRLSDHQQSIVDAVLSGQNVLFTGPAGVGKSTVVHAIQQALSDKAVKYETLAFTGKAAEQIKGRTICSFAFKDLGRGTVKNYVKMWKANKWAKRQWTTTKVILIDEISMVGLQLFEKFEAVARGVLGRPATPFGGIQIVACGDFFQLPPIDDQFCFHSTVFCCTFPSLSELVTVYRQKGDPQFLEGLHDMRVNVMNDKTFRMLQSRVGLLPPADYPAIRIYPKNMDVDHYNFYQLKALSGPDSCFDHEWLPSASNPEWLNMKLYNRMIKNGPFEKTLRVKAGAFVRYTFNTKSLNKCNGSMGIIQKFDPATGYPIVRFADGDTCLVSPIQVKSADESCSMIQVPLKLAWAATVHRLQGAQVDAAVIDLGPNVFEFGQGYTAVSRVISLQGLYLLALDRDSIVPHPEVVDFVATYPRR